MWIAIVIVVLAVAMMVGPIMFMQPTKRQRRLAKLRTLAAEQGLKVRMLRMPDGAVRVGESVALYYRDWPGKKPLPNPWMLVRLPFSHGLHFAGDWDWVDKRTAPTSSQEAVRQALAQLPASVIAVEATSHSLGVGWLEQMEGKSPEQAIDAIVTWLEALITKELSKRSLT